MSDTLRRAAAVLKDDVAWAARKGPPYASPDLRAPLADWLDLVATRCEEADRYVRAGLGLRNHTENERRAIAVARTILRESEPGRGDATRGE